MSDFDNTKPGDELYVSCDHGHSIRGPYGVTHTTATRIELVMDRGSKWIFRRKDGQSYSGDVWSRSWLLPNTPENAAKDELQRLQGKATYMVRRCIIPHDADQLRALIDALSKHQPKESGQ